MIYILYYKYLKIPNPKLILTNDNFDNFDKILHCFEKLRKEVKNPLRLLAV